MLPARAISRLPISRALVAAVALVLLVSRAARAQEPARNSTLGQPAEHQPSIVPYYMQSPLGPEPPLDAEPVARRALPGRFKSAGMRRLGTGSRNQQKAPQQVVAASPPPPPPPPPTSEPSGEAANQVEPPRQPDCFYERRHLAKLDECLVRRPYPTLGLPAFKNEDLLLRRAAGEQRGCLFVLNNGLFKNYQVSRYALDAEGACLDGARVGLALGLANTTVSYLWSLRCLNHADQLLDDATLGGRTLATPTAGGAGLCAGSSQNFGFTSLQLSQLEAHVDLAMDIYKNWRVTNITLNMVQPQAPSTARAAAANRTADELQAPVDAVPLGTNIRDFVFESLDGDELNWRYLHLYQNWARNRMHTNFLDQYRRFLWISVQRCLSEASEKLPLNLHDVFMNQHYV